MGLVYSSKQLKKLIEADGWFLVEKKGSHAQFKHAVKPGRVTIPHPKKDIALGTAINILRQAGLR